MVAAPKARKVFTSEIVKARVSSALVKGISVKRPVLCLVRPVKTVESCYRSGNPSKRIALTAMELSALRLAARMMHYV